MSQVFGDPKRLVNDYMAGSHAIGIRREPSTVATIRAVCHAPLRWVHLPVVCTLPKPGWFRRTTVGSLYRS